MVRRGAVPAVVLLLGVVVCPLASAGLVGACHADEAALGCCLPHEGAGPSSPSLVKASLGVLAIVAGAVGSAELPAPTALVAPETAPLEPAGPRLHSRISVFLI